LFHIQFLLIHIWQRRSSAAVASVAGTAMFILAAMAEAAVMLDYKRTLQNPSPKAYLYGINYTPVVPGKQSVFLLNNDFSTI
jgi:hypothetical protein